MRFCILSVTISTILWVGSASATDTTGKEAGEITGKDGAPMIRVPAGQFPMGVPKGDRDGGRDRYPGTTFNSTPTISTNMKSHMAGMQNS